MRNKWSGLGLLLLVPWLANCVSGPVVRLDTGEGSPIVLVTAAIGGQTNFMAKGPRLPGFRRAALASPMRTGVRLQAADQVGSVALGSNALTVVLAPAAVAATAIS